MEKIWKELEAVYDLLEDDLSKQIYERKVCSMLLDKDDATIDLMYETYPESRLLALEKCFGKKVPCVVAGAGCYGDKTYRALTHAGYEVTCFIDNDERKQGKTKNGKPVLSFAELCRGKCDAVVILDNMRLAKSFFNELVDLGYPQNKLFLNVDDTIRTTFGNIYFDLPQLYHAENEVFLDAGSFDGESTKEFIRWCGGKYKKIYAFEPLEEGYLLSENNLREYENIELIKCALSDENGETTFVSSVEGLMGARIGDKGERTISVPVRTIDSILGGEEATFIKMDIEGAELAALKGAIDTLRKYKPKLAISLYHKNEDLIDIPLWLHKNVPGYRYYLRHYSNKRWDFVLYCI